MAECGVPALIKGLTGQVAGTKVPCTLNGVDHQVELLAIRNPPPAVVIDIPAGDVVQVGEVVVNADGSEEVTYERVPKDVTVH